MPPFLVKRGPQRAPPLKKHISEETETSSSEIKVVNLTLLEVLVISAVENTRGPRDVVGQRRPSLNVQLASIPVRILNKNLIIFQ